MVQDGDASEFLGVVLEKEGGFSRRKASALSEQFSTLNAFYEADFKNIKLTRGWDRAEIALNDRERAGAESVKKYSILD